MEPTLDQVKQELKQRLNREVEVEKTLKGQYICQFIDYNAPMSKLVGDTEELAYRALLTYLQSKEIQNDAL